MAYISGENSSKVLYGTSLSDDIVTDGSIAQVAYGMSGRDTLSAMPNRSGVGTSAADTLYGGEGNDVLSSSDGKDTATHLGEYKNFSVEPGFASQVFYAADSSGFEGCSYKVDVTD